MRTEVNGDIVILWPTKEEVKELCRPGEGKDTCIWLMSSEGGLECDFFNRPIPLFKQWARGLTSAQRSGCDPVKALDHTVRYVETITLEDLIKDGKKRR